MFAIFLHESMNPFHQIVTSFPTVIFTLLLVLCVLYWAVAVLGLVDLDILDIDFDGDIDAADSIEAQTGLAGLLLKFGLAGVPLTITLTILSLIGWLISYYISYFLRTVVPDGPLLWLLSIPVLLVVTYVSVMITAQIIKPIRKLFSKLNVDETKHIIGQTVTVRSAVVNSERGEGLMNDGGAGILLNIRAFNDTEFVKGDKVVVIEKLNDANLFRVVSESEFN